MKVTQKKTLKEYNGGVPCLLLAHAPCLFGFQRQGSLRQLTDNLLESAYGFCVLTMQHLLLAASCWCV